ENWRKNKLPRLIKARGMICPIGALGARTAPTLEDGRCLACTALEIIYAHPSQPDALPTIQDRDALIRNRHAAGASQAELARQFGISYQRVHQILRRRRK